MKWTETGAGTIHAAEQRFWVAVGDNADVVAERMTNGAGFLDSMAQFAVRGGPQPSMSVARAREIMGTNVFGVEEGMRHMNVKFRRFELAGFAEVPATDEELEEAKETHILTAVPSISIVTVRKNVTKKNVYREDNTWHLEQAFAARLGMPGWRLVRKTAVANSTSKTWGEQQPLLGLNDEVPSSRVLCYAMAGHFLATDKKLFSDVWVRTSDVDSDNLRVDVKFCSGGVSVDSGSEGDHGDYVGLASVRKSD